LKLILDCCVDIILYLIKDPKNIAAIHCKAGKGRTGVMICCYLIFSGLCKNADEAMKHYSEKRTYDKKGVTIPSQKRYIRYFESFLKTNYSFPYIYMIPKIIKYHLKTDMTNILNNFVSDSTYFFQQNSFFINYFKIGPFQSDRNIDISLCDFFFKKLKIENKIKKTKEKEGDKFYVRIELTDQIEIRTDIKIEVRGPDSNFELWCNLWYSTLEVLKDFIDETFKNYKHLTFSNFAIQEGDKTVNPNDLKESKLESRLVYNELNSNDEISANHRFMKLDNKKNENGNEDISGDIHIESMTNLFEIIEKVNHNRTDLNLLIANINKICQKEKKTNFNKKKTLILLSLRIN